MMIVLFRGRRVSFTPVLISYMISGNTCEINMDRTLFQPLIGKTRSPTEIAAAILAVARDGETRNKIMEQSRLNTRELRLYLEELLKLGLIETNYGNRDRIYMTSEKGVKYLLQYDKITNLLE
jgi:predicted transcriptional regulator